ncbi:phage GP46 family protein [Vibrio furnissii]|uniref:phage GP46 family protein n=1 Tax=Vibrio furnissii TaxID=29494 RepID=UPI001558A313|nr:phage GP46 family protein [Vibrio furnissii]
MSHFSLTALTAPVASREGLMHAIKQSLYNHGEATRNDRARMGTDERGGCWSDGFIESVASRNWTISREKLTPQTLNFAKRFCDEALAWLVSEGHVKHIEVTVWQESATAMRRDIVVTLSDGDTLKVDA